jgi:hypothetical protein
VHTACAQPATAWLTWLRAACLAWTGGLLARPTASLTGRRARPASMCSARTVRHSRPQARSEHAPWHSWRWLTSARPSAWCTPHASPAHGALARHSWEPQLAVRKAGNRGAELTSAVDSVGWLQWSAEVDHASGSFSEVGGCFETCQGRNGKAG